MVAPWERGQANICWGVASGFHRNGLNPQRREVACPHVADEEAEAQGGEVACPRPPNVITIRSLWIFHIPQLPRELNEQEFPG